MRALVFGIALMCASIAHAQNGPVEIPFAPPEHTVLEIQEVRTRTSTDARGPNGGGRVTATLEIDGGEPPYTAMWTTTRVEANGQVIVQGSPGAAQLLVGMPIGLDLAENGSPSAVQNWPELQRRVMSVVTELTPTAERTEEWRRAHEATERLFASMSPSDAARLLFQDVGIMALCQHTGLTLNQPLQSETMTPNPLGGSPIRTLVTYELTSVNQNAGVAHVVYSSAFDPISVAASVREMIERMTRETGRTLSAEELESQRSMTLVHNARAECVVDLRTGVARSIVYDTTIDMGSQGRRTDRRELTITPR
jgi:hypothetical protein